MAIAALRRPRLDASGCKTSRCDSTRASDRQQPLHLEEFRVEDRGARRAADRVVTEQHVLDPQHRALAHAADNRSLTHDKIGNIASVSFAPAASAWQAGTGDVVAVRTITGTEPSRTTHGSQYPVQFTDTLQLVRVP